MELIKNDTSRIQIREKPDWIAYDEIHELLWRANAENRETGFVLETSLLNGDALRKKIGPDGRCFIALDGERLVGSLAVYIRDRKRWYVKGKVADFVLIAVDPAYRGKHILKQLFSAGYMYSRERNCGIIELDTADRNRRAIEIYKHYGFRLVGFKANPGSDHYSVIMAKWLDKSPYSPFTCRFQYLIRRLYFLICYRKSGERRFGL